MHEAAFFAIEAKANCTLLVGFDSDQRLNDPVAIITEITMRTTQTTPITRTALDAYVLRYAFVREKIERLQQLADDHFDHDPNAIQWSHVGDLGRVEQALDELLAIFNRQAD